MSPEDCVHCSWQNSHLYWINATRQNPLSVRAYRCRDDHHPQSLHGPRAGKVGFRYFEAFPDIKVAKMRRWRRMMPVLPGSGVRRSASGHSTRATKATVLCMHHGACACMALHTAVLPSLAQAGRSKHKRRGLQTERAAFVVVRRLPSQRGPARHL